MGVFPAIPLPMQVPAMIRSIAIPPRAARRRSSRRRRRFRALLTLGLVWLALIAGALVPREDADAIASRSASVDHGIALDGYAAATIEADARRAEAALYAAGEGVR